MIQRMQSVSIEKKRLIFIERGNELEDLQKFPEHWPTTIHTKIKIQINSSPERPNKISFFCTEAKHTRLK